jgi:outer membrane protein assembly factor BamB
MATPLGCAAMGPTRGRRVVLAGSTAASGDNTFALSALTGRILWRFSSAGWLVSSPAIANATVYWGSGCPLLSELGYTRNDKLYAFTLNGT